MTNEEIENSPVLTSLEKVQVLVSPEQGFRGGNEQEIIDHFMKRLEGGLSYVRKNVFSTEEKMDINIFFVTLMTGQSHLSGLMREVEKDVLEALRLMNAKFLN